MGQRFRAQAVLLVDLTPDIHETGWADIQRLPVVADCAAQHLLQAGQQVRAGGSVEDSHVAELSRTLGNRRVKSLARRPRINRCRNL